MFLELLLNQGLGTSRTMVPVEGLCAGNLPAALGFGMNLTAAAVFFQLLTGIHRDSCAEAVAPSGTETLKNGLAYHSRWKA